MNRHNFHQFNPNSYKKHLSPLGRNVLDNLIRNWRSGFNNANERRHQQTLDQNKRNSSLGDSRSSSYHISSAPSTPAAIKTPFRKDIDTHQQDTHNNDAFPTPLVPATLTINYESLPKVPIHQLLRDNITHDNLPNVVLPSSAELVRTIDPADTNDDEILTANDMITPIINFKNKANQKFLQSKKCNDDIYIPPVKFLEVLNKENDVVKTSEDLQTKDINSGDKNVNWSDMFDTELFPDLHGPGHFERAGVHHDDVNGFKITFHKAKNSTKKGSDKTNALTVNAPEMTIGKRKQQMNITDTVSKKVKKVTCKKGESENVTKNGYMKMKYTKAVKNWLNDVDPSNLVEEEIEDNNITTVAHSENLLKGPSITLKEEIGVKKVNTSNKALIEIEKKPKEKPKKVIQARLAQKDGKMKFGLPSEKSTVSKAKSPAAEISSEIPVNTEKKTIETLKDRKTEPPKLVEIPAIGTCSELSVNTETKGKETIKANRGKPKALGLSTMENSSAQQVNAETKSKETVKEKKTKPKFIAPIKSQIPVKNVSFDVKIINESNIGLMNNVLELENNEIVMVLVYRNGFCQLNNHHTEETCVPEGIMIQFNDNFFYLKEENIEYGKLIEELVHKMQAICYNGKQLLMYLKSKFNIELKQCTFNITDAKIGGSLIDPDNPPENFAELQKILGFTPEFTIATECVLQKAAWYITLLSECFARLKSLFIENSLWNVFKDIEMRLLPIIAGMEYNGVSVDLEKLKSMEDVLLKKIKAVEQECYKAAGKTFQINSTLQVRTILYDELQLDTKSNLKIKETISKGAKSTSETMLRGLISVHPLPKLILEYRHLHKAHATFLTGIAQHVKDGLVKPTWEQTAAATGRIASNNPNLQAIPKAPFSLVMFPDDADDQEPRLNFRSVYTARAGHALLAADFKHIECRVFAHAAADEALLDALRSGRDLFRVLAAKWLNKPEAEISVEDRERTKRIVYASLYGAGARKLMEILRVGYEQALAVMSSFNRTFPSLKAFGRACVARACAGALGTLCGRARRFRHIASADFALRSHAERQAVNFVVQGSAADLCKKAMVQSVQRLQECTPPVQGRLVLQIHDELVWEILDEDLERAAAIIKEAMENIGHQCGMAMTLPVEMSSGRNWGEMQPYHLTE